MTGKTIRIFLADGEPTGILLAEISNWTGKVLVAPRSQLDQLSKREEVWRTGVYLLVGPDPDDPSRALAYIGEGDNVTHTTLDRPPGASLADVDLDLVEALRDRLRTASSAEDGATAGKATGVGCAEPFD